MLRGGKHGHIHSNFRNDANSGKGLDTRHRHNKVELRKIFLSSGQNQGFQMKFVQFKAVHVGTDDAELFSLFFTRLYVHGGKDVLISRFHAFGAEARNICNFLRWIFQNPSSDCGGCFAKHIIQFMIGDSQAVLRPVFLASGKVGEFPAITE